jgi:6-phosphogluconate dehydrogenase
METNLVDLQKRTFLVEIAVDICRQSDPSGHAPHLLNTIQDKVVQDADDTEGTGTWCAAEAVRRHVSAPTIIAAHFLRVASADRAQRLEVADAIGNEVGGAMKAVITDEEEKKKFEKDLRLAVYASFLVAFAQGMNLIIRASNDEKWNIKLSYVRSILPTLVIPTSFLEIVFVSGAQDASSAQSTLRTSCSRYLRSIPPR